MCGLIGQQYGVAPGVTTREISARCSAIAAVLQRGRTRPAVLPRAKQMATKAPHRPSPSRELNVIALVDAKVAVQLVSERVAFGKVGDRALRADPEPVPSRSRAGPEPVNDGPGISRLRVDRAHYACVRVQFVDVGIRAVAGARRWSRSALSHARAAPW
jgi:hypothetical protein